MPFADYILGVLMFIALCGGIVIGFPVTFTLAGLAVLFAIVGILAGAFDAILLGAFAQRIFGTITNEVLIAIPLFVFMGVMLERSRIAEELLDEMGRLFGRMRGGLAISVTVVGALLAASTGIVGATVVTMGLIALPTMLRRNYDRGLAAGTVASAGTLGQIIPPSTVLIILAEAMSSAYQQAQYAQGLFSIQTLSVGQVFAAALVPGLVLVLIYLIYIAVIAILRPERAPALSAEELAARPLSARRLLLVLLSPIALIVAVLGSILGGLATPTEAASVGAVGATVLAALRRSDAARWPFVVGGLALLALLWLTSRTDLRLGRTIVDAGTQAAIIIGLVLAMIVAAAILYAFWRLWRLRMLGPVMTSTMTITAMIFGTLIGATMFALVFRGIGGEHLIHDVLGRLPGGMTTAVIFVLALIFFLGFVMDYVEISIIVLPIVAPVLLTMGVDPIWLTVLVAMILQTSFLTPPFGFSLFYLRGAAPSEIRTIDIYRGVIPFVLLQIAAVFVLFLAPGLATWLPRTLF